MAYSNPSDPLATRIQFEKHGSVSAATIPAVGVVSSRERREPLAQSWTRHTYIKSGRHESDAACAYPYSPRRELNRRASAAGGASAQPARIAAFDDATAVGRLAREMPGGRRCLIE